MNKIKYKLVLLIAIMMMIPFAINAMNNTTTEICESEDYESEESEPKNWLPQLELKIQTLLEQKNFKEAAEIIRELSLAIYQSPDNPYIGNVSAFRDKMVDEFQCAYNKQRHEVVSHIKTALSEISCKALKKHELIPSSIYRPIKLYLMENSDLFDEDTAKQLFQSIQNSFNIIREHNATQYAKELNELITKARILWNSGDYQQALPLLKCIQQLVPKDNYRYTQMKLLQRLYQLTAPEN